GEGMEEMAARRGTSARRLRALLRGDLDNIVAKALKKRVQDRYASAETLAEDLRRHLAHEPVSARADSLAYRAGKFARRRRGAVAAFIAVSLLLGSLVTFYTSRLAAERDRARHQADKAARVSELLKGLLTAADPYQAREKREPTVREILDAGAERMARDLAAQPELQAEMLTVMGSVYQRLGAHEKAKPLLEQAVASGRRAPGPQHELVAQSLHELGIVLREKGDTEAAAALLQEALALRRRLGPQDSRIADTLQELAYLEDLRGGGRFETYAREALDIRRQALGEEHRDTVSSLNDLGLYLLLNKGEVASAEPLLRQCLAINRKLLRPDHPDVGTAMGNLALALQAKGDFAQAESLARQGLSISRKALGDDHLDIGIKLFNLAKALRSQGKFAEAAAALEEALRITRPALGPDHSRTVLFTVSLALVRLDQDRAAEAEPMLRHALRVRERTLAKDDARLGQVKSALGAVLTKLARYEEAESLLLAAERILAGGKAGGWEAQEARSNRTRLAALYEAWGRPDQAAPYRRLPSS
ncbi:MAG TPA: tetratricopeptide repeat protein, partial [Vicinamibacteria bacterium]|nr:tetratricopeptide repeat protein [Vicinamibacteria bacterium]